VEAERLQFIINKRIGARSILLRPCYVGVIAVAVAGLGARL
jgi:hypothetical protein